MHAEVLWSTKTADKTRSEANIDILLATNLQKLHFKLFDIRIFSYTKPRTTRLGQCGTKKIISRNIPKHLKYFFFDFLSKPDI